LNELFPDHSTYLTDSGRSAFALAIEHLNLQGKTVVLPAYVCDALLPVLTRYDMQPIFLDIDNETYQPSFETYTDEILNKADAVLLVATYGKKPDQAVVSFLKDRGKIIIEDYAMRSPLLNDPIDGMARIYSLPKTLPTPDGGIVILPKGTQIQELKRHHLSFAFIKNLFKLLPLIAPFIARIRDVGSYTPSSASWNGATTPSNITSVIFSEYCKKTVPKQVDEEYSYCYPLRVKNPREAVRQLRKHGISPERIWHQPIIFHSEAKKHFKLEQSDYPKTMKIASEIVCAPLWHIENQKAYNQYVEKLQEILADLLCE